VKVGELARRTGLTVRALHHYDAIGLLKPSLYSEAGHRLYAAGDVARLQRIVSLRQLGFSLDEIRDCLDRPDFAPLAVVELHVARLKERIERERSLCAGLEMVASLLRTVGEVSTDDLLRTIEAMTTMENLYTPDQMKQFEEIAKKVGPEEIQAVQDGWTALFAELRANPNLDPASPEARALADRWDELQERTKRGYEGYPQVWDAIGDNYKAGKFEGFAGAPQMAEFAFIEKVKAARSV
jgi:MerR family transcriptional regulator, thiopeptide resistance regulator